MALVRSLGAAPEESLPNQRIKDDLDRQIDEQLFTAATPDDPWQEPATGGAYGGAEAPSAPGRRHRFTPST